MSKPVKVKLSKPVEHNGTTYEDLTFREATVGDFMVGDQFKGEVSKTVAILASISEVPLPAFKQISAKDMAAIMTKANELLGNDATMSMAGGDAPLQ